MMSLFSTEFSNFSLDVPLLAKFDFHLLLNKLIQTYLRLQINFRPRHA